MNIVWFSWKDKFHPEAGGAELLTDMGLTTLAQQGHTVTLITSEYKNSGNKPVIVSGYNIVRSGGKFSVYIKAWIIYLRKYRSSDVVVDEINGVPFFAPLLLPRKKVVSIVHHIQREIWFYQIFFPINIVGYLMEPIYYILVALLKTPFFVVSESSKNDLLSYGVESKRIYMNKIFHNLDTTLEPPARQNKNITVLVFGALRAMKRTLHAIQAFELAQDEIPSLRLVVAGSNEGSYGKKILKYINNSRAKEKIKVIGYVSKEEKLELMRSADIGVLASVREGWCIVATEEHSQGLPTVVYNTNGLVDSTLHNFTGLVTPVTIQGLCEGIKKLANDELLREQLGRQALEDSKQYTFDNATHTFLNNFNTIFKY